MIKRSCILLLLAGFTMNGWGQDPAFSHYYANSLHLNPAMAGAEKHSRIFMNYRNQWPQTGATFVTYHASYDRYVEKLHGGLGFRVMNDQQAGGLFNTFNLDAMYAYQFRATRWLRLAGAVQATFGHNTFNPPDDLRFGDMINPVTGATSPISETIGEDGRMYPDFATGLSAFYRNLYGGVAVHHLLSPVVTSDSDPNGKIGRKYTVHAGMMIPVTRRDIGREIFTLSPNVVFMQQKQVQQLSYGIDMIFKHLTWGVWTRHDLSFNYGNLMFTAGLDAGTWRMGYSYDLRLSNPAISLPNMGAHEISLLIIYKNHSNSKPNRAIKYPKI